MSRLPASVVTNHTLSDLVELQRGYDLTGDERMPGLVPVIGGGGPNGTHESANVSGPGVVVVRSGSGFGNVWWVESDFWAHNTVMFAKSFKGNDKKFTYYVLDWLDFTSYNSGGAQPSLNRNFIYSIPIILPPLPEQRKIAEILSTWDEVISAQERLIANARAQKRALMQTLLPIGAHPPKKRLPGFSGDWESTTLENVAQVIVSNVDKKSGEGEQAVRLCNYMDVYRADWIEADMPFMRATAAAAQIRKFGLRVGDVLITKDSETPDDIAVPSYVASTAPDLVCGYHLAIIRAKPEADGQFLKYYFERPTTQHFFASRANGATRFGLTIGAIESAPITLPSPPEQRRIGEAIAIAELEIHRLLPIAEALRQEKSALMQQLLTGKRRVRVRVEKAA